MKRLLLVLLGVMVLAAVAVAILNFRDEEAIPAEPAAFSPSPEQVKRGEYLARAGNCYTCHTARGGAPFAGGVGIGTPFGTVYSSNITPDAKTGIGRWSAAHFWRALHNGRSRDGRLLYPAFPYPNYTHVTREDADAIFAYLLSVTAVEQVNRAHELRFPYNNQAALAVWRALYFEPGVFQGDATKSAEWNRGAYLVRGLGHCVACHGGRNVFGATSEKLELSGGVIPMQGWYAPSLSARREAGVADWSDKEVIDLLRAGVSARGSVMGPMADVVYRSTQYLSGADLRAMALFLKALPQAPDDPPESWWRTFFYMDKKKPTAAPDVLARGSQIYKDGCAGCHGENGEGAIGAYPALAGNRAVTMDVGANLIRVVLSGGFLPATGANPRPYGMPPFAHVLGDADIAAVVTYIRASWGNAADPVTQLEVMHLRAGRAE